MFQKKGIWAALATAVAMLPVFGIFAACTPKDARDVSILVKGASGETILTIEARYYESNIVVNILSENNEALQIPQAQLDAGFITTIAGTTAVWGGEGDQWWWRFDIDGKAASVGIRDARVKDGAVISFILVEGFS